MLMLTLSACTSQENPPSQSSPSSSQQVFPFTDITDSAGLGDFRHENGGFGEMRIPEIMGSGGGLVDYDGDGLLDVVLVGGGSMPDRPEDATPAISFFRNQGAGVFADVTESIGLAGSRAYGFGLAAADYDNDGDVDLFLSALGPNLFFRNDEGVFREVSEETGLADIDRWSTSALFFDADLDGDLDLYVVSYLMWSPETDVACVENDRRDYCNPRIYPGDEDAFYRNNGDGTFTNQTQEAGFSDSDRRRVGKGLGVTEFDYNRDGWPDLYVTNDGQANFLFTNDGDGTFTENAFVAGIALDQNGTPRAGMGVDAGVIDSTGRVSVIVGNFSAEMAGVWRLEDDGLFSDRASTSRIGFSSLQTLTFGLSLFDADLDTDLDLLFANGHVIKYISDKQFGVTFEQSPQYFQNRGDGVFDEVQPGSGILAVPMLARGLATGDIDGDGDLDVLFTENGGPAHLLRNDLPAGNYLRVRLRGAAGNRDALGARIRAMVGGLTMERRIRTASSYLSQSELVATFGLGEHQSVDMLEIIWPGGEVTTMEEVAGNREVLVVEGEGLAISE